MHNVNALQLAQQECNMNSIDKPVATVTAARLNVAIHWTLVDLSIAAERRELKKAVKAVLFCKIINKHIKTNMVFSMVEVFFLSSIAKFFSHDFKPKFSLKAKCFTINCP